MMEANVYWSIYTIDDKIMDSAYFQIAIKWNSVHCWDRVIVTGFACVNQRFSWHQLKLKSSGDFYPLLQPFQSRACRQVLQKQNDKKRSTLWWSPKKVQKDLFLFLKLTKHKLIKRKRGTKSIYFNQISNSNSKKQKKSNASTRIYLGRVSCK